MTSLRERKKERTRRQIVAAAADRIARQGVDATTMEDVAAAAEVSVGTVYNYFGSKSALLLAVVAEDVAELVSRGASVLRDPGPDPVDAVGRVIDVYLGVYLDLGRDLMREVVYASFGTGFKDLMPELLRIDEALMDQLRALLVHYREKGLVGSDLSLDDATTLLFSIVTANLIFFVSVEDVTEPAIRAQVRGQVQAAFHGLGTRASLPGRSSPKREVEPEAVAPGPDSRGGRPSIA